MKSLLYALVLSLALTTGSTSLAEASGWQAICTAIPGETRDYCEVSRTVVQKTEDGAIIKVTLTVGFTESIIYSRALPLQGFLGKMMVKVKTGGGRLARVSIKIKPTFMVNRYERTVSCDDEKCTFRNFSASVLASRMEWVSNKAAKKPDPTIAVIIKLRFASPFHTVYVSVPLVGFQEAIRSTRE